MGERALGGAAGEILPICDDIFEESAASSVLLLGGEILTETL